MNFNLWNFQRWSSIFLFFFTTQFLESLFLTETFIGYFLFRVFQKFLSFSPLLGMRFIRGFVFVRAANLQHDMLGLVSIPRRATHEIKRA